MTERTRAAVTGLFDRLADGASPDSLAAHFHPDVDWYIPGDTGTVPWIGRKVGRTGVAEFYQQLRDLTVPIEFTIEQILVRDARCVVLGHLITEVKTTGRRIDSDFAFDLEVVDDLITRYHMFEDTWAVAAAFR